MRDAADVGWNGTYPKSSIYRRTDICVRNAEIKYTKEEEVATVETKRTLERKEEAARLHSEGLNLTEIAILLEVANYTASRYLREQGITPKYARTKTSRLGEDVSLCFECTYKDCIWNGEVSRCPMNRRKR